jgi:DNA-binding beta-propeller fold protein YncE
MTIEKPELTEAQAGAPITAEDWNAMIHAVKALRTIMGDLRTHIPAGILVTVRDRDSQEILPSAAIQAVYAVHLASNTPTQPGQRAEGGGQAYLIPIEAQGEYDVSVEATPESGYQGQTQQVTVGEDIALVDFLLWERPYEPVVPLLFGQTLRDARAVLDAESIPVGDMLDAHGQIVDPATWEVEYGNRLVLSTEPGAGMTIAGEDTVDILVAARRAPEEPPEERLPVLVDEILVVQPTRLAISPDGKLLYVLSQASGKGSTSHIVVIDTARRRVVTSIETGEILLLNVVFEPEGRLAYVSGVQPGTDRGSIGAINVATHKWEGRPIPTPPCHGLDITADGTELFATVPTSVNRGEIIGERIRGSEGKAIRIDLKSGEVSPALDRAVASVDIAGDAAYFTDYMEDRLWCIAIDRAEEPVSFSAGRNPLDLAVAAGGAGRGVAYVINRPLGTGLVRVDLSAGLEKEPETIDGVSPQAEPTPDGFLLSGIAITPKGVCVTVSEGLTAVDGVSLGTHTVDLGGLPAGVAVEPPAEGAIGREWRGKYAYVANYGSDVVQVIDLTGEDEPFVRRRLFGVGEAPSAKEAARSPAENGHLGWLYAEAGSSITGGLTRTDAERVAKELRISPTEAARLIERSGLTFFTRK